MNGKQGNNVHTSHVEEEQPYETKQKNKLTDIHIHGKCDHITDTGD